MLALCVHAANLTVRGWAMLGVGNQMLFMKIDRCKSIVSEVTGLVESHRCGPGVSVLENRTGLGFGNRKPRDCAC